MHSKISFWETRVNQITADFKSAFGELDTEALNWKPSSSTWSIGQVIDHLIVINKTYFPVIERIRNNTYRLPWMGKMKFMVRFWGNFILKSVEPERRRKIKTFPIWEPSTSHIPADILLRFETEQQALITLIISSNDLLKNNTVISSPANRNVVYTLEKAFDIITTHEQRHLNQAIEIDVMRNAFEKQAS